MRHSRFSLARRASGPRTSRSRSTHFVASQEMRDEAWRRRFAMEEQFSTARPGRGHLALANLYRAGKSPGRDHPEHRQSASSLRHCGRRRGRTARQYHLSPSASTAVDGTIWPGSSRGSIRQRASARLPRMRRPHQDRDDFLWPSNARGGDAARRRAHPACDLFLAIGSSLVVWPAAGFPLMAKRNGARLAILNRERNRTRCHGRSGDPRRHRYRIGLLHRSVIRRCRRCATDGRVLLMCTDLHSVSSRKIILFFSKRAVLSSLERDLSKRPKEAPETAAACVVMTADGIGPKGQDS